MEHYSCYISYLEKNWASMKSCKFPIFLLEITNICSYCVAFCTLASRKTIQKAFFIVSQIVFNSRLALNPLYTSL